MWAHLDSFCFTSNKELVFRFGFSRTWLDIGLLTYQIEYKACNLFWNFCPHWWCKIRTSLLMTVSKHDHYVYHRENRIIFASSSISGTSNKAAFLGPKGFRSTFFSNTNSTRQGESNFKKKSHPGHHLQFSFHYYLPRINTLESCCGSLSSY